MRTITRDGNALADATAPAPAAVNNFRLWGGRFADASAPALEAVNRSIGVDFRLWPHDIRASKAWAVALGQAGVLTLEESMRMERGLDQVAIRIAGGVTPKPADEDVHTLIDRLLHEEIGPLAAKLHTGRSRNDQVATSTRLWAMEACVRLDAALRDVQHALIVQAEGLIDAPMPGYTHLQQAQPISGAQWALAHVWPLSRDRERLLGARKRAAELPLGSGAIAGSGFPVSRTLLQGTLGFASISDNSVDAVSDRDFVAELLFTLALAATHTSRLAEDLVLFGSTEFGFVEFGERFTTGSSMMPQKRNPDALELARGSAGRALGNLVSLLATLKGLPTGYNKDLQDDKRALFDGVDAALLVLPALAGAIAELHFRTDRMRAAIGNAVLATDLADALVREGVPFRDAHAAVGRVVRAAESRGCAFSDLPAKQLSAAHPAITPEMVGALTIDGSLAARSIAGGTAPSAVREQLAKARAAVI